MDAVLFNRMVVGADAHAKNYSLLLSGEGRVHLAPLYDIASALPYPGLDYQKLKLAMKLGGEYRLGCIGARHVGRMAAEVRQSPKRWVERARELPGKTPETVREVADEMRTSGLGHERRRSSRPSEAAVTQEFSRFATPVARRVQVEIGLDR
ncbi:MAG: HipA domain-containing protein [Brevundimonas sp.]|uniref:HipA domain-containing protein n=1 Tax=Brevundimonas sp. TaxID=1871086 RepID=UPI002487D93D|nr:HipA domain-containing protein [Brevundimonas sp.]MDI1325633.1 HipA domain-containing protein [Brevundimonas sp.]